MPKSRSQGKICAPTTQAARDAESYFASHGRPEGFFRRGVKDVLLAFFFSRTHLNISLFLEIEAATMPDRPIALVYRGESTEQDDDLAEPLAAMIKASPYNFKVKIVGPNEDEDVDEDTLEDADLFAYPGGPDLDTAWGEIKQSRKALKAWIDDGGELSLPPSDHCVV